MFHSHLRAPSSKSSNSRLFFTKAGASRTRSSFFPKPHSETIQRLAEPERQSEPEDGAQAKTPPGQVPLQLRLTIGQPHDAYEQEADSLSETLRERVADQVVSQIAAPQSTLMQPQSTAIASRVTPLVMRQGEGPTIAASQTIHKIQQTHGGGQPLDRAARNSMEQAFGNDFSQVRVHADSQADQLNRSLNARAFTTGQDIYFKQGEYQPGSPGGQKLLAHELTHVMQQQLSPLSRTLQCAPPTKAPEFAAPSTGTTPSAIDVTFYSGDPDDPAAATSKAIAESRYAKGTADVVAPIRRIEDIHHILQLYAYFNNVVPQQRKQAWDDGKEAFLVPDNHPGFVRSISVIGHGVAGKKDREPFYGFGEIAYKTSELAAFHRHGLSFSRYMVDGGKVVLEGCDAAAGQAGRLFLLQIGQIFFGAGKQGLVRGNTGKSMGFAGEMLGGGAIEFKWPHEFLDLDIPCDPLETPLRGLACMPKDGGFVLVKASNDF
ncbi:MAG: DUF4157 domain-containing protein [Leptolyngbya sp. SIOISBB]|nr:DUF4157 domain-containing protein [Leptolyngbya sp. SIOISBB]